MENKEAAREKHGKESRASLPLAPFEAKQ